MALTDLRYELQGNQRLAIRDCDAGDHPDTGHFVPVSVAAAEAAGGAADQEGEGVAVIMMNLEHPEHPNVRIKGSIAYFDTAL